MRIKLEPRNEIFFDGKYIDAEQISYRYKNNSYLKETDSSEAVVFNLHENVEIKLENTENKVEKFDKN